MDRHIKGEMDEIFNNIWTFTSLLRLVENLLRYYSQAKMTTLSKKKIKDDTLNTLFLMRERETSDCK